MLIFATPRLCQSRVCGPVVDVAEQLKADYGDEAEFIHMEIFHDNDINKGLRPQPAAWRLPSEPWAFTIGRRRPGGGAPRGRLQRARARGRAAEGAPELGAGTLRVLLLLAVACLGCSAPAAAAELPLGPRSLDERRSSATLAPGVRWTSIVRSGGPWRVNVLSIAPGARVLVVPGGDAVGERERPSRLARRARALAAVNGGYFAADGNPAGVLAPLGALISEPVGGRSALLLGGAPAVAALRFAGSVAVAGEERLLDGVNRRPGLVPACGGRGGDRPTERPDAATTCTDPSELVAYTPEWGAAVPRIGRRVSVRGGVVVPGGGGRVPADGFVLAGTGDAAAFLRRLAAPGAPVALDLGLRGAASPLDGWRDRGRRPAAARARPGSRARRRGGLRAAVGPRVLRHVRGRTPAPHAGRACGPTGG